MNGEEEINTPFCPCCGAEPGGVSYQLAPGQASCPTDDDECPVQTWDTRSEGGPPDGHDEKLEDMLIRARVIDGVSEINWLEDVSVQIWENPQRFGETGFPEKPEEVGLVRWTLFEYAVLFGIEYEHYYPRGTL